MKRLIPVTLCALLLAGCGKPASAPSVQAAGDDAVERCPAAPPARSPAEQPQLLVQDGHAQPINLLALSGDGALLASASLDQTLRLWDVSSGLLLKRIKAPRATSGIALDARGQRLAYALAKSLGHEPHVVRVLHLADDRAVEFPYGPFALSRDGSQIAIGPHPIRIFDTTTGKLIRSLKLESAGKVVAVALNADGSKLAAAVDTSVVVFDTKRSATVGRAELEPPSAAAASGSPSAINDRVYEVFFAGDDVLFRRGAVGLYVLRASGVVERLATQGYVGTVAVAGARLWTVSREGALQGFDLPEGKRHAAHTIAPNPSRLAAAADGRTVAVAYIDLPRGHVIELIDSSSGHVVRTVRGLHNLVGALAMTGDASRLAVGSVALLSQWTMPRGEMWFSTPEGRIRNAEWVAYDGAGKQLASYESVWIRIREAATGQLLRAWRTRALEHVEFMAFRPGTSVLVAVRESGVIEQYDLSGERPEPSQVDADNLIADLNKPRAERIGKVGFAVEHAAMSPDGSSLLVMAHNDEGGADAGKVALLDARTGEQRWSVESPTMSHSYLGFTADGTRALLSSQRRVPWEELKSKEPLTPILRAFAVDSGTLVADVEPGTAGPLAAKNDRVVVGGGKPAILDADSLETRATIQLRDASIQSALAHPTQDAFLLGGIGGATALVSTDGELRSLLISTVGGDYIATTPDGAYRASLDGGRRLAWAFPKPLEAFSFEQFAAHYDRPDLVARRLAGKAVSGLPQPSRPPRVTLPGPRKRTSKTATVKLRASVSSRSQVERIRAYANGRLAADQLVCKRQADVELSVPLQPGDNRIALVATDSAGLASNTELLDVRSQAAGARPDLWIVAIGVSEYPELAARYQLQFADDDAMAMAESLQALAGAGKPFAHAKTTTLTDAEVSVASIEKALAQLAKMKPHDLAVVFLAGHGLRLGEGKMHFLTHRATLKRAQVARAAIGWDRLEHALAQASGRVVMLLDACHSGHVTTEPVAPNEALAQALAKDDRTGILVFAASRGSQLSYEVGGSKGAGARGLELAWQGGERPRGASGGLAKQHGLFTSAMLEALAGKAPDRDESGAIELGELIDYVTERVRGASNGRQTPWVARRELFGDFPLAPSR